MFLSVCRYCPAHFHVSSNIFRCNFRTYSSETTSAGLPRRCLVAHSRARNMFCRSHSFSSSFVARLGIKSASSSGEIGVFPSPLIAAGITGSGPGSECVASLLRFSPAPLLRLGPPAPWCAQRHEHFLRLGLSPAPPPAPEWSRSWEQKHTQAGSQARHPQRAASLT